MLHGTAASDGIGIGRVMLVEEHSLEYTHKTTEDTEAESQRFKNAVSIFCDNTAAQADALRKSAGDKEAEILEGHIQIIKDPYLSGEIEKLIANGQCAEAALEHMCDMFISMFSSADDELTNQRAADVKDIKTGILSILLGINEVKICAAPKGTVIVAKELTPSMTAGINKENIVGIITETGGKTSHSAILARALEIPAVLSVNGATTKLSAGEMVITDGCEGIVIASPDENLIQAYTTKQNAVLKQRRELEKFRGIATKSKSGENYELFCNIGNPDDAIKAIEHDGEGAGLFRTEFLFMDRNSVPTEEEQFNAYKKAALILKNKPLIIRTLDIGGDKALPYLGLKKEENPFMGFRAIRYCLKNQDLFKTQLRAILRASSFGDIKVMFPLVTAIDEFRAGKQLIDELKTELKKSKILFDENIKIGVMMETASAAVIADTLAKEADFFSIGTNDLIGYTMACDRGNNEVSNLYSAFQPSVLRLIKYIIDCGTKNNIPVGMCGETASNEMMIPLLISFGLTEFSVSAPSVLKVRKAISKWTKSDADKVADKVMQMATEKEVSGYLKTIIR